MSDSIDSVLGVSLWIVFLLSVMATGLIAVADPPLSTLAEDTVLLFVFGLLFIAIARVLYSG